ncbi:Mre11 DNA-binding presumed domain-containing protein [Globomyces pollinis-pini]|nr:Mre11 DNA-binding presumed domain-containing protein [Globomyces pollinis-pini]
MTLIRKYCFGDSICAIEILSDQSENFPKEFPIVNYQDPNLNVSMPIFSIHGNHDDPNGDGNLCALDMLSVAGLVNYFGKQTQVDNVEVKPILLRKGDSRLALYGLGNIRDERLNRTFEKKKVTMFRPNEHVDEWFNLLVLHQNRIAHSAHSYIPEKYIDDFINLVLWGHEHECRIDPEGTPHDTFITQPGSSVATSLCEGEAVEKKVGILSIKGDEFKLKKIRLKTVRPFEMDSVVLQDVEGLIPGDQKAVEEYLTNKINDMILAAKTNWQSSNPTLDSTQFPKPLIRLKVEYSGGFVSFNSSRFGQRFVDEVANPRDILMFHRKLVRTKKTKPTSTNAEEFLISDMAESMVEDLISKYLDQEKLEILPENELNTVVASFVAKNDKDAISAYVDDSIDITRKTIELDIEMADDVRMKAAILNIKESRTREFAEKEGVKVKSVVSNLVEHIPKASKATKTIHLDKADLGFEDEVIHVYESTKAAPKTSKRTVSKRKGASNDQDDDMDISGEEIKSVTKKKTKPVRATTSKRKAKVVQSSEEEEEEEDPIEELLDDDISSEDAPPVVVKKSTRAPARKRVPARKVAKEPEASNWTRETQDEDILEVEPVSVAGEGVSSSSASASTVGLKRGRLLPTSFGSSAPKKQKTSSTLKQTTLQFSGTQPDSGSAPKRQRKLPFGKRS